MYNILTKHNLCVILVVMKEGKRVMEEYLKDEYLDALSREYDVSQTEAAKVINLLFEKYPSLLENPEYIDDIIAEIVSTLYSYKEELKNDDNLDDEQRRAEYAVLVENKIDRIVVEYFPDLYDTESDSFGLK